MLSKKPAYHVAVVGVGAVGLEMLRVLRQRTFPIATLTVLARSARTLTLDGASYQVQVVSPEAFANQDIVLFAGTEGEQGAAVTYAQEAIRRGAVVIDNGADFRMDPAVPLVVPEVNADDLKTHRGLIANPNCSTIQMIVALAPVHRAATLRRVIVASYQAASGAGREAVEELKAQVAASAQGRPIPPASALPQQLAFNVIPQIGPFAELGYTSEEWKMIKETRKILHADGLAVTATTVRVPVVNAHSEAVYFETERPITVEALTALWRQSPGVRVVDPPAYPMPLSADGRDEVFIGRLRPDPTAPNAFACWVVADNLRKGAALNAVQIAEALIR
ncbi:MAG: aspartate-semialdehyde dehydrogenase [Candidatus Omnitrophica bacterium]|nr:aspartate-semialdehyde dehydrogenase [Candidatus Omnitrophota bacterium]